MALYEELSVGKVVAKTLQVLDNVSPNYEFVDGGQTTTAGGDTTETITRLSPGLGTTTDLVFAGYSTTNDTDNQNPVSIIQTNRTTITAVMTTDPSTAHVFDWMVLRKYGRPTFQVFAAGTFTTAGGDASESITVAGALAGDLCLVQVKTKGSTPRVVSAAAVGAGAITVTMSGDPSTDHVLAYVVLRPVGNFTPSHYVFAAGNHTTVGGAAAEAITVAGVKSSDIAFACLNTTNDTDLVVSVTTSANTVTVTGSADPLTAHAYSYFVLRETT